MSEADRVFPRRKFSGPRLAPEDKHLLQIAPQRGRSGSGRVVEVVHLRPSRAKPADFQARLSTQSAPAEARLEDFDARPAPTPPPQDRPATASNSTAHVGHLMPGWEPLLPPVQPPAMPNAPTAKATTGTRRTRRPAAPDRETLEPAPRSFADPFDAGDTGSNCIRCGYLIDVEAEKHGLMIWAQYR